MGSGPIMEKWGQFEMGPDPINFTCFQGCR